MSSLSSEESSESSGSDSSHGPLVIRQACRFNCYCSCHPRTEVERDDLTTSGKPFTQSRLTGLQCDEPNCQTMKDGDRESNSVSNFLQKALSRVAASHSVRVRHHITTFHIVPESSDVMRYTKQGDLDNLKAAIQSGRATLWDTAPDGWSLLHVSPDPPPQDSAHILQTAAYNRQLPTVRYLLDIGADTEVADIGARLVRIAYHNRN